MIRKINFINPFGTDAYDGIMHDTLSHYAGEGTVLDITHLDAAPADPDYFYPKHFMESAIFEGVMAAEEAGYHAVISGCCFDPGVRVARELVDIPVVGPMEASLQTASYFGNSVAIVTDHRKCLEWMRDHALLTGLSGIIRGWDAISWYIRDMIQDPKGVARDVVEVAKRTAATTGAEAIILNCTIIAACYQRYLMDGGEPAEIPIINPNLMALKKAESLADLYRKGAYHVSRVGFYQKPPEGYYANVSKETRKAWLDTQTRFAALDPKAE